MRRLKKSTDNVLLKVLSIHTKQSLFYIFLAGRRRKGRTNILAVICNLK